MACAAAPARVPNLKCRPACYNNPPRPGAPSAQGPPRPARGFACLPSPCSPSLWRRQGTSWTLDVGRISNPSVFCRTDWKSVLPLPTPGQFGNELVVVQMEVRLVVDLVGT